MRRCAGQHGLKTSRGCVLRTKYLEAADGLQGDFLQRVCYRSRSAAATGLRTATQACVGQHHGRVSSPHTALEGRNPTAAICGNQLHALARQTVRTAAAAADDAEGVDVGVPAGVWVGVGVRTGVGVVGVAVGVGVGTTPGGDGGGAATGGWNSAGGGGGA